MLRSAMSIVLLRLAITCLAMAPLAGCPTVPCFVPTNGEIVNAHGFGETASVGNLYRREGAAYVFNPWFTPQPVPIRAPSGEFVPPQKTIRYDLVDSLASYGCIAVCIECTPNLTNTFTTDDGSMRAWLMRLSPSVDEHYRRPRIGLPIDLVGRMQLRVDSKGFVEAEIDLESRESMTPDEDWLAARERETARWLEKNPGSKALQDDVQAWAEVRRRADAGVESAPLRVHLVFQHRKCLDYSRMP